MLGISADFKGCEILVAAALSGDSGLLEAETSLNCWKCGSGGCGCEKPHAGLHWRVAHEAFGREATKENRYMCKPGVFTRFFGGGPETAADQVGCDVSLMQRVFDALSAVAPVYTAWDKWLRQCYYEGMTVWRDYETGQNFSQKIEGRRRMIYRAYSGRQIYVNAPHAAGNYCIAPGTPILRSDLRHVRADEIHVGERLVAFDEQPADSGSGNKYHRMRTAVVEAAGIVRKPSVCVRTSDGKQTVCSTDHQWLVRAGKAPHRGPRIAWKRAGDLVPDDMLLSLGTWEEDFSRTGGYLAGLLDGEACLESRGGGHKATGLTFSQLPGITMTAFCAGLKELGLPGAYRTRAPHSTSSTDSVQITGIRNIMRVLGTLQPARFQPRFEEIWEGAAVTAGLTETAIVEDVEKVGVRELTFIQTSTRTLVANGYLSHNSIQGTARELLLDGLLNWKRTRWGNLPVVPVHDQAIAFVPAHEAQEASAELKRCMETTVLSSPGFEVRIGVDLDEPFTAWQDSS